MSAHDGGVEHLKDMRRRTHGRERVEEGLEDAGLAQAVEALPYAVPRTEALRQSAPANVLDGEEMKRLEETAVVRGLPSAPRQTGAKHRKRVRPIVLIHLCRHGPRPLIRSESYESCLIQQRNPKNITCQKSSTQPRCDNADPPPATRRVRCSRRSLQSRQRSAPAPDRDAVRWSRWDSLGRNSPRPAGPSRGPCRIGGR
jgi:hypothetical protein